jgi:hypothetical protein
MEEQLYCKDGNVIGGEICGFEIFALLDAVSARAKVLS